MATKSDSSGVPPLGTLPVNRSRFLALTAALAASASACAKQPPSTAPLGGEEFNTTRGDAISGLTQGQSDEPVAVVNVPEPVAEPEPIDEGTAECGPPPERLRHCDELRMPGPQCEQGFAVERDTCERFEDVMDRYVAQHLTNCLVDRSHGSKCGAHDALGVCAERALDRVCEVDRSNARQCEPIVDRCERWSSGSITLAHCEALLTVIKPEYQDQAITCMSEGCGSAHCFFAVADNARWRRR